MNLLTRAVVSKLISDNAKTEFSCGKLSVSPSFNGTCTVRFPIMFTPYKTVGVEAVAKKFGPETGYAAIGIELKRNGAFSAATRAWVSFCWTGTIIVSTT